MAGYSPPFFILSCARRDMDLPAVYFFILLDLGKNPHFWTDATYAIS